jgi:hypothetical protein
LPRFLELLLQLQLCLHPDVLVREVEESCDDEGQRDAGEAREERAHFGVALEAHVSEGRVALDYSRMHHGRAQIM